MATRMQQRRGTAATWTSANPILGVGEIGYETDTNKFKIGDGSNRWANLTYFVDANSILDGAPELLSSLNDLAAAIGDDPAFFTTVATNLANHEADTTNVHGIANTALLATKSYADTAASNAQSAAEQTASADATSKANAAQAAAISTAATDATTKANAALASANTYTDGKVADLIDSAPGALDTLNELAAALGDNASYATTITNALALKAPLANPTFTGTVSGITKSMVGLGNIDNTADVDKPISTATQSALDLKAPIASPTFTGTVSGISKAMVGLGNVDNTSDADKPVSTATQTALDLKAPIASPTFTGTVSGISKAMVGLGNVNNTADINKPISNDMQSALDLKAPLESPTFTGTVSGISKAMVGLGNVDNTSDANKPISTAAQSALDLKAPLASPDLTGIPTAPTAALGTNTTQVATTAFVDAAIEALASRSLVLDGGGV